MTREDIYTYVRSFAQAQTPWRHRGRTATALDCGGVIIMACRRFDVPHQDIDGYSRYPDGRLMEQLGAYLTPVVDGRPRPGMVAALRVAKMPCHVGVIGVKNGELTLIHSSLATRCVREEPFSAWEGRLRALFDFPGVED